jgi:GAF domain-containing protein
MVIRNQEKATSDLTSITELQSQLVTILLRVTSVIGLLAAILGTVDSLQAETDVVWPIGLYWGSYLIILVLNFWRSAPYALKAWAIVGLLFIIGATDFLDEGLNGSSQVILMSAAVIAGVLLGRRAGQIAIGLTIATMLAFAWVYTQGLLVDPNDIRSRLIGDWLAGTGVVLLLSVLVNTTLNEIIPQLTVAFQQSQTLTNELKSNQATLERQIQEHTANLQNRNRQMALTAQVTREFSTIHNLDQLLNETVNLISDNFNFYHTGIFLLDETGHYAVLKAASSKGGRQMLARNHQLRVGEVGMVGYVTDRGVPRISLDVGEDAVFFNNPDLPATRSEMTLPLQVRGELIGALDVQSTESGAFDEEDVTVLQSLADQLALAINNTRLLGELQETLGATQRAYGEVSRQEWGKYLRKMQAVRERYDPAGILSPDQNWSEEMRLATNSGESVLGEDGKFSMLAVPIKERGQIIGVLNAYKSIEKSRWTQEEISLMEVLTDQIGVALESARSYQDTQLSAIREQITSEATARIRETLDIETIVQSASEEIRKALNLPEVTIRLGQPETELQPRS